ncbi:MAG: DUF2380 domain-containing protein [Gammaproteobacteria bacterium]
MIHLKNLISCFFFLAFSLNPVLADTPGKARIAVLEFELKDLTFIPGIQTELDRTASIKALLESQLKKMGYDIVDIGSSDRQQADAGTGYLFDHHDSAAKLAKKHNADFVIVGRLHKPSYLFAYLMAHLINVSSSKLTGDFISEVKGVEKKLTLKGVESLAVKIDQAIGQETIK